jgi:hypothetical protein
VPAAATYLVPQVRPKYIVLIDESVYLKRSAVRQSDADLVEIDLVRAGQPMPAEGRPRCTYSVLVSRADRRPRADFWPFGLRDLFPPVPVPLRPGDGNAWLDLRTILDRVYDESGYKDFIYKHEPDPPLTGDEQVWARSFLPAPPGETEAGP